MNGPKLLPLQKVVVFGKRLPESGCGDILGEHGVVIWRSHLFVEKTRYGTSGRLYVVYFPRSETYERVEESRLMPTNETIELALCVGRDYEISYDRDGAGPDAISGTFRLPGEFWKTFAFRSSEVNELTYQVKLPIVGHFSGIAAYEFTVPQSILLDCCYIEAMLSRELGAKKWRCIIGPESRWFG